MEQLEENRLATEVLDIAFAIHRKYGPGLYEQVYERIFHYELTKAGFSADRQLPVQLIHDGQDMGIGFRADLIVNGKLLVELKAISDLKAVHEKQVITYLRLMNLKLGLLINFNEVLLRHGIRRIANGL